MPEPDSFQPTACNLCSLNCGIEIEIEERRFKRIRGDENHPASRGYRCQKASRLDFYQNHERRLRHPLRNRPDITFEKIDWDTAIREVVERLVGIRDTHGYGVGYPED
jgi:formate dehydrogenase